MRITVQDCLKLDAFQGSRLLSCKRKADGRVRSISVLDEDNLSKGVERNGISEQMVITHFWTSKNDIESQCRAVTELGRKGIAALVVFLNEDGIRTIDPRVVVAAENNGLLLITIEDNGSVTYAMLMEQVLDKILYGHNYSDNILNNTIYHLLNFDRHSSFPVALKEAALNNEYQIVLMTEEFNPILTIETRHLVLVDRAVQMARDENILQPNTFTKLDVDDVITYWGYITINGRKYPMTIVDNEDNYSATEMKKLAEIIELAIGMWKYTPERDSKAEFIKSAIRGDLSFCYTLLEEAGIRGKQFVSVFHAKVGDKAGVEDILNRYKKQYDFGLLLHTDGNDTYGMLYTELGTEEAIHVKTVALEMYEAIKSGRKDVRFFHVTGTNTLDGAVEGFRLINRTWNYAETVFPYKRLFSKYEMAMLCDCVNLQSGNANLKKMYLDLLEPFSREISTNKGKILIDTLATFVLDAGMNSSMTASFMAIHNNTVQYRLKKINDILGADLTTNRVIPGLTIALAIMRLEEQ